MARVPKLRKHARGSAFVEHRGRRIYLGPWGSEKAKREYAAFLNRIQTPPQVVIPPGLRATVEAKPAAKKPAPRKKRAKGS